MPPPDIASALDISAQKDGASGGAGKLTAAHERYANMLALHKACEEDLLARGLDDAHAWLPSPVAKRFGRSLESLGWIRDDAWTPYCFRLERKPS